MLSLTDKVKAGFPESIEFPAILSQLCYWLEQENSDKPLSGYFELFEGNRAIAISAWIDQEAIQEKLGIFGMSADGGLYCIWLQDNGKESVIYLGSGQNATVLARNIEDFILLLAVGYNDICFADVTQPPEAGSLVNPEFQVWVRQALDAEIPVTGQEIVETAKVGCDNVYRWLVANRVAGW
jgi:hypothetical protein